MKISKLIKELQDMMEKHGDKDVEIPDDSCRRWASVEEVCYDGSDDVYLII